MREERRVGEIDIRVTYNSRLLLLVSAVAFCSPSAVDGTQREVDIPCREEAAAPSSR